MKWLAPLIIVVVLVIFGAWFCSKHEEPAPAKKPAAVNSNVNTAANGTTNTSANTNSANTNAAAANSANTNAAAPTDKPVNANANK